jgi:hypothetical protein
MIPIKALARVGLFESNTTEQRQRRCDSLDDVAERHCTILNDPGGEAANNNSGISLRGAAEALKGRHM